MTFRGHEFTVSGIQAKALLDFNKSEVVQAKGNELEPMVGSLLKKVGEVFTLISDASVKDTYCLRTIDILALMSDSTSEEAAKKPVKSTKYVHKQHKFRVQALIIRRLKRERSGNLAEFIKQIVEHFKNPPSAKEDYLIVELTNGDVLHNL